MLHLKVVFILLIFLLTVELHAKGQTDTNQKKLMVSMELIDTVGKPCQYCYSSKDSVYKFKMKSVNYGKYQNEFIYVCADYDAIHRNFYLRQKDYWWTLYKFLGLKDNIPIYQHGGNW